MPLDNTHRFSCTLEAIFPLSGTPVSAQYRAALCAALRDLPGLGAWLAEAEEIAIAPLADYSVYAEPMTPTPVSRLLLRLPAAELPRVLGLAGQHLDVGGYRLEIGEPRIEVARPAAALRADLVVLDDDGEPAAADTAADGAAGSPAADTFMAEIRRQLEALEIHGEPNLGPADSLKLPDRTMRGFVLAITGLSPEDSIHLQEIGLGGYRTRGCGVFLAA